MISIDLLRLTIVASQWNGGSETTAFSRMARAWTETRAVFPLAILSSQVLTPCHGHAHREQFPMQLGSGRTRACVSCRHKGVVQKW